MENNKASGSDTVEPTATRAPQALVLSSQLCLVLLLIAESWLEWGEERLEVQTEGVYWTERWREEERDGEGSGRWSLIRDWTAANLPAASAQHRDYWGGRNREYAPLWFTLSTSLSSSSYLCFILAVFFILRLDFYLPCSLSSSDSFCESLFTVSPDFSGLMPPVVFFYSFY